MKRMMKKNKPWPPDAVLEAVGMSKEDWDEMVENLETGELSRDNVILHALTKAILKKE